jgi:hypothetical protein
MPDPACTPGEAAPKGIKTNRKNEGNAMQQITEQMTQIMAKMMPYMWYVADVGLTFLALGALAWLIWLLNGRCTWLLRLSGRILVVLGIFFVASQIVGFLLGMNAFLNLADPNKYEFAPLPFWMIGLPFIVTGVIMRIFGAFRPTH